MFSQTHLQNYKSSNNMYSNVKKNLESELASSTEKSYHYTTNKKMATNSAFSLSDKKVNFSNVFKSSNFDENNIVTTYSKKAEGNLEDSIKKIQTNKFIAKAESTDLKTISASSNKSYSRANTDANVQVVCHHSGDEYTNLQAQINDLKSLTEKKKKKKKKTVEKVVDIRKEHLIIPEDYTSIFNLNEQVQSLNQLIDEFGRKKLDLKEHKFLMLIKVEQEKHAKELAKLREKFEIEIHDLKSQIYKLLELKAILETKVNYLEPQINTLEQKIKYLENKLQKLENDLNKAIKSEAEARSQLQALKILLEAKDLEISQKNQLIDVLTKEKNQLVNKLLKVETDFKTHLEKCDPTIKKKEKKIMELNAELKMANAEIERLRKLLAERKEPQTINGPEKIIEKVIPQTIEVEKPIYIEYERPYYVNEIRDDRHVFQAYNEEISYLKTELDKKSSINLKIIQEKEFYRTRTLELEHKIKSQVSTGTLIDKEKEELITKINLCEEEIFHLQRKNEELNRNFEMITRNNEEKYNNATRHIDELVKRNQELENRFLR